MGIRNVIKLENGRFAYVHFENEYDKPTILGNKDFPTREAAENYSKGFAPDSFVFQNEVLVNRNILDGEITMLNKQIDFLNKLKQEKIKQLNDLSGNSIHTS